MPLGDRHMKVTTTCARCGLAVEIVEKGLDRLAECHGCGEVQLVAHGVPPMPRDESPFRVEVRWAGDHPNAHELHGLRRLIPELADTPLEILVGRFSNIPSLDLGTTSLSRAREIATSAEEFGLLVKLSPADAAIALKMHFAIARNYNRSPN